MPSSSGNVLILRTPHLAANSSSRVGSSSSSSSYRVGRWNHLSIEFQNVIYQFLNTSELTSVQVNRTWRKGYLDRWDILTQNQYRFHWREANSHPRLNHLLTQALMDVVFRMTEERDENDRPIASKLRKKYQYLMDIVPSFKHYVMMRLIPNRGPKIERTIEEFQEIATIYKNSEDLASTSDALLYVLMEIENGSSNPAASLNHEKLVHLLNFVLRAIDNGVTCASLLMTQMPHVWPLRMLEQMAIASLMKEDYRALETLTQTYSRDDLQRLQSDNPGLILPPVLYRLALQEEDLYKQDVALKVAIGAYGRQVSPKILCAAASVKFNLKCYTEAIDLAKQAMRVSGDKVPDFVLIKLANFMFKLERYEEADLIFMQMITRDEANTPALIWYRSASTKRQLKQYEKAYEHYMRAIKEYEEKHRNKTPPDVLVDGAYAILDLVELADWNGEAWDPQTYYEKADEFYTVAIRKYRNKVPDHVLIDAADLKLKLKRYKEADKIYSRLIKQLGNEIAVEDLNSAAFTKLMLGWYRASIRLYTQVIEVIKKKRKSKVPADILANMALANLHLKRYKDAVIFYAQAIKEFGNEVPPDILKDAVHAQSKLSEMQEPSVQVTL